MSGYVTLMGAEQVQSAASSMRSAADQMERAASSVSYSMDQLSRLVDRLEAALRDHADRLEALSLATNLPHKGAPDAPNKPQTPQGK